MKERLIEINNRLIDVYSNDEKKLKKHELIKKLLEEKNCFLKLDIEDAFAILRDLGVEEKDLKTIYKELIDIEK